MPLDLGSVEVNHQAAIRQVAIDETVLLRRIVEAFEPSRERSLASTKLDEFEMWLDRCTVAAKALSPTFVVDTPECVDYFVRDEGENWLDLVARLFPGGVAVEIRQQNGHWQIPAWDEPGKVSAELLHGTLVRAAGHTETAPYRLVVCDVSN